MSVPVDLTQWSTFLSAEAGAAAALTGLLFVGVSMNLSRILSMPFLPLRALLALMILVAILIATTLLMVPGQTTLSAGLQLLLVGGAVWALGSFVELRGWVQLAANRNHITFLANVVLQQAATLPYIVAGALVLSGNVDGLFWFAIAVVFSFVKSVTDSWVLLVEINR